MRALAALGLAASLSIGLALAAPVHLEAASSIALRDLDGHAVDPFRAEENATASVFLFTSVDCPISNRYAPEVRRIHDEFAARGVAFWMVYPNPAEQPGAIREHLNAFGYPGRALRDPDHALVKLSRVTVTPEAAVFDRRQALVYHGRIDDRYVRLGLERPAATVHDLADALRAVLGGAPVHQPSGPAVGCYISDFVS